MITNTTKKIANLLKDYKSTLDTDDQEHSFAVSDVCDLNSLFWINTDHDYISQDIPATVQQQIIDQYQLLKRAHEEKQLVLSDAVKIISTLENELWNTNNSIAQLLDDISLDPSKNNMINSLGSTDHLSQLEKGKLSALISCAQLTSMRLCRTRDTLSYLSRAYYNEDNLQKEHLKSAACHGRAMLLPPTFTWNDANVYMACDPVAVDISESEIDSSVSTSSCSTDCSMTEDNYD